MNETKRRLSLIRRGVVVNDLPSLFEAPEDQRVKPARFLAVGHCQFPSPAHDRRVCAERLDVQVGEDQLAHLSPFGLVSLAGTFDGRVPARKLAASGEE